MPPIAAARNIASSPWASAMAPKRGAVASSDKPPQRGERGERRAAKGLRGAGHHLAAQHGEAVAVADPGEEGTDEKAVERGGLGADHHRHHVESERRRDDVGGAETIGNPPADEAHDDGPEGVGEPEPRGLGHALALGRNGGEGHEDGDEAREGGRGEPDRPQRAGGERGEGLAHRPAGGGVVVGLGEWDEREE